MLYQESMTSSLPPQATEAARMHRIVLPLDGTPMSEGVLEAAAALAQADDAELLLLRAYGATSYLPSASALYNEMPAQSSSLRDITTYLDQIEQTVAKHGVQVWSEAIQWPAAHAIVETAHRSGADLVVMATHLSTPMPSRITVEVLRRTRTPVLLLPPSAVAPVRAAADVAISDILVLLDEHVEAISALRHALRFARIWRAKLTIAYALDQPAPAEHRSGISASTDASVAVARAETLAELEPWIEYLTMRQIPAEALITEGGLTSRSAAQLVDGHAGLLILPGTDRDGRREKRVTLAADLLRACPVALLFVP